MITATHLEPDASAEAPQADRRRVVIWAGAVGFSLGFWVMALVTIF